MKRWHAYGMAALLCVPACFAADEPEGAAETFLGLATLGEWDGQLVERVRAFAERKLLLPVRLVASRGLVGSLGEEDEALADLAVTNVLAVVVLAESAEAGGEHGVFLADSRIAVVHAGALAGGEGGRERYARRLEKQVMRGFGLLMGLPPCPNPFCALHPYRDLTELDAISRDLCPPCTARLQERAVSRGAQVIVPEVPMPFEKTEPRP